MKETLWNSTLGQDPSASLIFRLFPLGETFLFTGAGILFSIPNFFPDFFICRISYFFLGLFYQLSPPPSPPQPKTFSVDSCFFGCMLIMNTISSPLCLLSHGLNVLVKAHLSGYKCYLFFSLWCLVVFNYYTCKTHEYLIALLCIMNWSFVTPISFIIGKWMTRSILFWVLT